MNEKNMEIIEEMMDEEMKQAVAEDVSDVLEEPVDYEPEDAESEAAIAEESEAAIAEESEPAEVKENRKAAPKKNFVNATPFRIRTIQSDNDMIQVETLETRIAKEIDEIKRSIPQKTLLSARVIGEERVGDDNVKIIAQRGSLKIFFDAKDFFELSQIQNIEKEASSRKRQIHYMRKIRRMHGASIMFLPVKIISDTEDNIPVVLGSRAAAMSLQQYRHFYGPKANVEVGVRTVAEILSNGPEYVIANVLGVETRIWAKDLSAFKYIEDVSVCPEFQPGNGIEVLVTDLKVNKSEKTIELSVSKAMLERLLITNNEDNMKAIRKGGTYSATVIGVRDNYYKVVLDGFKVIGLIKRSDNKSNEMLSLQDRITMMIYGHDYERGYVWGGCYKS